MTRRETCEQCQCCEGKAEDFQKESSTQILAFMFVSFFIN